MIKPVILVIVLKKFFKIILVYLIIVVGLFEPSPEKNIATPSQCSDFFKLGTTYSSNLSGSTSGDLLLFFLNKIYSGVLLFLLLILSSLLCLGTVLLIIGESVSMKLIFSAFIGDTGLTTNEIC